MTKQLCLALYSLRTDGNGVISWNAPDGKIYQLDPRGAPLAQWIYVNDTNGKPVMAYMSNPPTQGVGYTVGLRGKSQPFKENPVTGDGVLVLSIDKAPGFSATLLCEENDVADRQYYYATDGGNHNPLERPAFILRAAGIKGSPLKQYAGFRVLIIE